MLRPLDIVLILGMVATAAVTYSIKYSAESTLNDVRSLDDQIAEEQNNIDLLKADLALLSQPARLQRLANFYSADLGLEPTEPEQIAKLSQLPPIAPPPVDPETLDTLAGTAPDGTDIVVTGSVKP
ncbi:hypothetical protein [Martelella sp. HB161492]|uniref:cell division protein FtsL n=1 Tax=Martelella sp. HB161492 TaxID=2720726 RepID=UPI001590E3A7|nr:hypothetical protein [Martelella sp. HB161492]